MSGPPTLLAQIVRFALVGVAATAVHFAVLIALVELAGLGPVAATTLGYIVGIAVSYTLNRLYTFKSDAPVGSSFLKFALLYGVSAFLNAGIVAMLTEQRLWYLLAQVIATGLVLIWNFVGARFVVFR
jgi:putative flippase GtrA